MANYWIGDAKDRVLGPIAFETLRELVSSGRIHGIVRISLDGQSWSPVDQHPEIATLQSAFASEARRAAERQEAQRLRVQLQAMQARPPHEIFGLPAGSDLDAHRAAFFRLVKHFFPDSLPPEAAPELREAYNEAFRFLTRLMSAIERQPPAPTSKPKSVPAQPSRPPPQLAAATSKTITPRAFREVRGPFRRKEVEPSHAPEPTRERIQEAATRPTYAAEEFVGLDRRGNDRLFVTVQVTVKTCGIFTENKLINLSTGGAFIPCNEALDLGEQVDILFKFGPPHSKEIAARGSVVWWNAGDARQPRGFGVKFDHVDPADRSFIEEYLREAASQR
jgi:uncharacterized protein (TIGR02266 family)